MIVLKGVFRGLRRQAHAWGNDPPTKDRALARSQSAAWVLPPPYLAIAIFKWQMAGWRRG